MEHSESSVCHFEAIKKKVAHKLSFKLVHSVCKILNWSASSDKWKVPKAHSVIMGNVSCYWL